MGRQVRHGFVLIVLCSFLVSCGGGGSGASSGGGGAQTVELPNLNLKSVDVTAPALQNVTYSNGAYTGSDLLVISLFSQSSAGVAPKLIDADKGQIVFLETPDEKAVAIAYLTAAEIKAGRSAITLDHIADGFIMSNPLMMGYENSDRMSLLATAKQNSLYQSLKNEISNALTVEPANLLNPSVFPKTYEYAIQLILAADTELRNALAARATRVLSDVFKAAVRNLGATASITPVLDHEPGPYVGDVSGSDVLFVNPTMTFYGVDIDAGTAGAAFDLVPGKEQAWSIWGAIDPVSQKYSLGDGSHSIRFTKGLLWGSIADDMALAGNILRMSQLIIDTFSWCPISSQTIAHGVKQVVIQDKGSVTYLASLALDIASKTPEESMKSCMFFLRDKDNWRRVTAFFYANATDKEAITKYLSVAHDAINAANVVLKAYDAVTTTVPFFWDYYTAPWEKFLVGTQTNGLLTENFVNNLVPPIPSLIKISPQDVYVGDAVSFDASGSTDDKTPSNMLEVRLDFNGDTTFDTNWTTVKLTDHAYANPGAYSVILEVRDSDGQVARYILNVNVKTRGLQGLARHIKLFRDLVPWAPSSAFEQVMADLGYTEGFGEYQYEILSSSSMASNIMRPGWDFVVISNDQPQTFYNNLSASIGRFDLFLNNGGAMLWEACDQGWNLGSMANAGVVIPGGVIYSFLFDNNNLVAYPESVLMSGLPPTLTGYYSSHEFFTNLPPGAVVYITNTSGGATLLEYHHGSGSIMLSGNPLEWGYDRISQYSMGLLYPRVFAYVRNLRAGEGGSAREPPAAPCVPEPGGASKRDTPSERACVFSGGREAGREKHPPVKAARDGGRNVARKGVSRGDQCASVLARYL